MNNEILVDPEIEVAEISVSPIHMGSCQNYGPFLGTLNNRCRIIIGTQKGTLILTTTHILQAGSSSRFLDNLGCPLISGLGFRVWGVSRVPGACGVDGFRVVVVLQGTYRDSCDYDRQ